MLLRNRGCLGCTRMIRRHWLKFCLFSTAYVLIIILFLHWKYNMELLKLNDISSGQIRKIEKMVSLSTGKWQMNDTWRIPDVRRSRIFSAYLDLRPEVILGEVPDASYENLWALIRIIAILPVNLDKSELTCYYEFPPDPSFFTANKTVILESPAIDVKIVAETENFGMAYSAAFVLCKMITTYDDRLPLKVTFSSESGKTYDLDNVDFVDVHYTKRTSTLDQDRFMSVCIPSLHHNYDKHINLIEFVEFYRMMGVDHFFFYNTSVSKEVSDVLTYYKDLDVATVIQWQLPSHYVFERTLRYNGIYAGMNDCLYRSTMVGGFKYVVNVDLDEFIVPRIHDNFKEMMEYLDPVSQETQYADFIFRNMFFYLMYEDDPAPRKTPDLSKLLLYTKTRRLERINPAYDRSKYIARGQEVIEMGNHRVWHTRQKSLVYRTNYPDLVVDPNIAASQHYRFCEVNELVCWLRATVNDANAHRFTNKLEARITEVLKSIKL